MPSFALIAEGVTDQRLLERFIQALFDDQDDLSVTNLQPPTKEAPGNWDQVLKYCASERFRGSFQSNDFVVIHLDSDISEQFVPPIPHTSGGESVDHDVLIAQICDRLAAEVDRNAPGYFEQRKSQIIFAIAIHSTECWLLPLFYTDSRRSKTDNCLGTLNAKLQPRKFSIDKTKKQIGYDKLFREPELKRLKRADVLSASTHNSGLAHFVAQVERTLTDQSVSQETENS